MDSFEEHLKRFRPRDPSPELKQRIIEATQAERTKRAQPRLEGNLPARVPGRLFMPGVAAAFLALLAANLVLDSTRAGRDESPAGTVVVETSPPRRQMHDAESRWLGGRTVLTKVAEPDSDAYRHRRELLSELKTELSMRNGG
jgi:anti-sigma factor RsiW